MNKTTEESHLITKEGKVVRHDVLLRFEFNGIFIFFVQIDLVTKGYTILNGNKKEQFVFGGPDTGKILYMLSEVNKEVERMLDDSPSDTAE